MASDVVAPSIAWLAQLTPFMTMEHEDLRTVAELCRRVSHAKGTQLIHQGDYGDSAFVIARGRVVVMRNGVLVSSLGPGALVGEIAMVQDPDRTADVHVVEDADLAVFDRDAFLELLQLVPSFDRLVRQTAQIRGE